MTEAVRVQHGPFGRMLVLRMDRPLVVHAHPQAHLLVKIGGKDATFQVYDKTWPLSDDFAVGVNTWESHAYLHADPAESTLLLVLYVEPFWLLKMSEGSLCGSDFRNSSIPVTPNLHEMVQSILVETLYAFNDDTTAYDLDREILALMKVAMKASSVPSACGDRKGRPGTPRFSVPSVTQVGDFRVRRAMTYMRENLGNSFDFSLVARQAGLSRPHFFELFRANTALTPNQYLNMIRMEQALYDLSMTAMSISEVAANLGFSAQSNFTRFFREHHGVSPSEYRRYATGELPQGYAPALQSRMSLERSASF